VKQSLSFKIDSNRVIILWLMNVTRVMSSQWKSWPECSCSKASNNHCGWLHRLEPLRQAQAKDGNSGN